MLLHQKKVAAIVPRSLLLTEKAEQPLDVIPVLGWGVRGGLLGIIALLIAIFAVAIWLNPYDAADGVTPLKMETHTRLGLPPCTFKTVTNIPCPSCGMTTSFALLVRGDLWASLQANAVGTLLAVVCLAAIPWGFISVIRGQLLLFASMERTLLWLVIGFLSLMLLRWAIVLGWNWLS